MAMAFMGTLFYITQGHHGLATLPTPELVHLYNHLSHDGNLHVPDSLVAN